MIRSRRSPSRRVGLVATAVTLCTLTTLTTVVSGCATGERPSLTDEDRPTSDDTATQEVLDLLAEAGRAPFRATYAITPTSTGETTVATVEHQAERTVVTVRGVEFVTDGTGGETCDPECTDGVDDARLSDLNITHRFWAGAAATRLRLDAARRVGFTVEAETTIAGQPARCVSVPLPGPGDVEGAVQYCALEAGPLASYFGADTSIELTSIE